MRITDTWEGKFNLLSQQEHPSLDNLSPETKVRAVLKGPGNQRRIIDTTVEQYGRDVRCEGCPHSTWTPLQS